MRSKLAVAMLVSVLCSGQALADGLADRLEGMQAAPLGNTDMEVVHARYISDNLAVMLASLPQSVWANNMAAQDNVWVNSMDSDGLVLVSSIEEATEILHSADAMVFAQLNASLEQIVFPLGLMNDDGKQ